MLSMRVTSRWRDSSGERHGGKITDLRGRRPSGRVALQVDERFAERIR